MKNKLTEKKKILLAIPYFFLWIIYFILTLEDRNDYMVAERRGMAIKSKKDVSWFFPGSTIEYRYDPTKKPERNFATWNEYWQSKGY